MNFILFCYTYGQNKLINKSQSPPLTTTLKIHISKIPDLIANNKNKYSAGTFYSKIHKFLPHFIANYISCRKL